MINWTTITEEIHKFVTLPASKQIIFVMAGAIVVSLIFNIFSYMNKRQDEKERDKKLIKYEAIIEANKVTKDSLVVLIYNIKLTNFEDNLKRSDSLLKESQKIRNAVLKIKK
jgi:hypothetical protein